MHPRWWLEKPLDLDEPLLCIRDPDFVSSLRGRPRKAANASLPIPATCTAAGRPPRQLSTRRLKPSIRRTPSQFERQLLPASSAPAAALTAALARRSRSVTTVRASQAAKKPSPQAGVGNVAVWSVHEQIPADVEVIPATQLDELDA